MIDWMHGYTSTWRICRIDPSTWEPCGEVRGIDSIAVERDGTDDAPMLETASVSVSMPADEPFEPGWHRIMMDAVQGTYSESVPIATLWLDSDSGRYSKGRRDDKVRGRSVLLQASEKPAGDGAYAPNGINGADWAARMLSECIDAPVSAVGSFALPQSYVFDLKSTVLAAVWSVLKANGWRLSIDGRGAVTVEPMPSEPELVLDRAGAAILMPGVSFGAKGITYRREYVPGIVPFSVVRGALPESGLDGDYRVTTQRLTCGKGITVEESAEVM